VRRTEKLKKKIENGLWEIELARDRWRHVTLKGQGHDLKGMTPIGLGTNISNTARDAI